MRNRTFRRSWAIALTLALVWIAGLSSLAAAPASVSGRVLEADGATPMAGVVVRLADAETDSAFDSSPADDDGAFRVEASEPGRYAVVVRDGDRVFVASESVALDEGENTPLALTVSPEATIAPAQASGGNSSLPLWANIVIAGGIGVAALVLVDEVTSDDEAPASPFNLPE